MAGADFFELLGGIVRGCALVAYLLVDDDESMGAFGLGRRELAVSRAAARPARSSHSVAHEDAPSLHSAPFANWDEWPSI